MEKFCEDIGVEPENIVMLVLAYKMGATQMGFFGSSGIYRSASTSSLSLFRYLMLMSPSTCIRIQVMPLVALNRYSEAVASWFMEEAYKRFNH